MKHAILLAGQMKTFPFLFINKWPLSGPRYERAQISLILQNQETLSGVVERSTNPSFHALLFNHCLHCLPPPLNPSHISQQVPISFSIPFSSQTLHLLQKTPLRFSISSVLHKSKSSEKHRNRDMGFLLLLLLSFLALSNAEVSRMMGVNYGQLGDNLPSPSESINLLKTLKAARVKIYDANPEILKALSGTPLQVSVMVPNEIISNISSNQSAADEWVRSKILPFYPKTRIRILLVGNEILSDYSNKQLWYDLVPAMRRVKRSLKTHNILNVKVGTPLAMDALQTSSPPSNATFRPDIADTVMRPLLQFLNRTKSFYFADVYPYFVWAANPKTIKLEYALLKRTGITYADPGSGLTYTNLLDQQLDALVAAMTRVGFGSVRLAIAETGWPTAGDIDQIGANIYNAATYNRNLAKKMAADPPLGTPARPGRAIPTFVFSLYNENKKPGPGTERNWGLFYPNGSGVYEVDLTGMRPDTAYGPLPVPLNDEPYKGKIWCVAKDGKRVNASDLGSALSYACGQGNGTCDAIQRGKECYEPNSLISHASYAFSSYWLQFRNVGGNCYFGGLAVQTTKDPSYGSCNYPAVKLTD